MVDEVVNRCDPGDIDDGEVAAALVRIAARDPARGAEADHVVQTLTWGEGMGHISRASLQTWLWYELPTKYLTDEVGYMGRLAGVAAELFDELGLGRYRDLCRSETTAGVHAAFEQSTQAGFDAFAHARDASGIDPPATDTFVWGDVMGIEESLARSAASAVLEEAIAQGSLVVGGRAWRKQQRALTDAALDADHPTLPGQSWRTAVLTERVGRWIAEAERRSTVLASLRAGVANGVMVPAGMPDGMAESFAPLMWLLDEFGEAQKLTQAGYLNTGFVRQVVASCPWPVRSRTRGAPRNEADAMILSALRQVAMRIGALRKKRGVLERTRAGTAMVGDPGRIWDAFVERIVPDAWAGFAWSTTVLALLAADGPVPPRDVQQQVADAAAQMGWQTDHGDGGVTAPSAMDVHWATFDEVIVFEVFGLLDQQGDWGDRTWELTSAGRSMVAAVLARDATGPRDRP